MLVTHPDRDERPRQHSQIHHELRELTNGEMLIDNKFPSHKQQHDSGKTHESKNDRLHQPLRSRKPHVFIEVTFCEIIEHGFFVCLAHIRSYHANAGNAFRRAARHRGKMRLHRIEERMHFAPDKIHRERHQRQRDHYGNRKRR